MPETDADNPMAAIDAHLQPSPEEMAAAGPATPGPPPPDASAAIDAHLQGPPAEPQGDPLIEALHALAQQKYGVLLAYMAYGDQLQTFSRDGISKHFHEHVGEEISWAYQIHRLLAQLGAPVFPAPAPVGELPLGAERPCIEALAAMEEALVAAWEGCEQAVDAVPRAPGVAYGLRAMVQEGARSDAAHAQDLRRYLGSGA